MSTEKIKDLAASLNITPTKKRGQNFLVNDGIIKKIIDVSKIKAGDNIIEIGPGFGVLTEALKNAGANILAVELENNLATYIKNKFHINVIAKNILQVSDADFESALVGNYKKRNYYIVANIPYQITGAVIPFFLARQNPPSKMILMLQKEVGDKLVGKEPRHSILSLSVQYFCEPRVAFKVSAGSFWPAPKVDSSVVVFDNIKPRDTATAAVFFKVIKRCFAHPRKKMASAFGSKVKKQLESILIKNEINVNVRPSELSIKQWENLAPELNGLL